MIELVKKERSEGIWAGDMKYGDVGVIVACIHSAYLGQIVQRHRNQLITIGQHCVWSNIEEINNSCHVRLLKKDEMLVVT